MRQPPPAQDWGDSKMLPEMRNAEKKTIFLIQKAGEGGQGHHLTPRHPPAPRRGRVSWLLPPRDAEGCSGLTAAEPSGKICCF